MSASGGLVQIVDWWELICQSLFGDRGEFYVPMVSACAVLLFVTLLGLAGGLYRLKPETLSDEELLPPQRFSTRAFIELCWAVVSSTLESVIGKERWVRFAPLLGGTFFFIIVANLSGLVPGFHPPTTTMNMTLGMASVIFFSFMWIGLAEGGIAFLKHMWGPVMLLGFLIFPIELIGMLARPISLSLRLFGNILGDHLVFAVFSTLMRDISAPFLPIPAALLGFGTLVACLQAFIFMTLSAVYMRLSLDSADHH